MKNPVKIFLIFGLALLSMISCSEKKEVVKLAPAKEITKTFSPKKTASKEIVEAVKKDQINLVRKLLEAGEDANGITSGYFRGGRQKSASDRSNEDWTLLMHAAFQNNVKMVKLLLSKKPDINAVNAAGHSALFLACANRSEEMAKFLLQNNADVKNAGLDESGTSALQWALTYGWNEVAAKMIQLGADLNTRSSETGTTVLLEAMDEESIKPETIHLLIDSGADVSVVNSKYRTSPLMLASQRNDLLSVKKILAKKVNINQEDENGNTALCYASGNDADDTELLKLLITAGAKVNIKNGYGRNALIEAVSSKSLNKVKFLLKNGALINRRSEGFGGVSPISVAAFDVNLEMVQLLIDNGADVSITDSTGDTVLLKAILSEKSYDIIKLLIKNGADVNKANNDKGTPLMKAAQYNLPEIVKLLLDSGAKNEGRDFFGKTALNYAEETAERTGDKQALNLLRN